MNPLHPKSLATAFVLLLGCSMAPARGEALQTVPRTIHSYAWGDRTYTCLVIDGGVVPLITPPGTTVNSDDAVKVTWSKDGTVALFRPASPVEGALLDLMDKPDGADAWKKQIVSTLRGSGYKYTLHDFQPDILGVNHWRIGAISMDYSLVGLKSSSLLMIWRCRDGKTLTVTLQGGTDSFKTHCDELNSMIGGAMILAK
jgi:hypothetical protein